MTFKIENVNENLLVIKYLENIIEIKFNENSEKSTEKYNYSIIMTVKSTINSEKTIFFGNIFCQKQIEEIKNLNINYKENSYAFNKILSPRRDKVSDREILISRFIDKCIRPLKNYNQDISLNIILLKYSAFFDTQFYAAILASVLYKKLFNVEISIAHLIEKDRKIIFNPKNLESFHTNIMIAADSEKILAIEMESIPITTIKLLNYFNKLFPISESFLKIINIIPSIFNDEIKQKININSLTLSKIVDYLNNNDFITEEKRRNYCAFLIKNNTRLDTSRKFDEIRTIQINDIEIDNSVIFSRGETSVISFVDIAKGFDKFKLGEYFSQDNNLVCHYIFNQFTGENKKGLRREIGHSDFIRKALQSSIHSNLNLRMFFEVLSANGSSSSASICAGSLALRKINIISSAIAAISIGCIVHEENHLFISDITHDEDEISAIDFKIAGLNYKNKIHITAIHMDSKIGIKKTLIEDLLKLAEQNLKNILDKMDIKLESNQRVLLENIDSSYVGSFIGPKGANINKIIELTKSFIKINDQGNVLILTENKDKILPFINFYKKTLNKNDLINFICKETAENSNIITTYTHVLNIEKPISLQKDCIYEAKVMNWQTKLVKFIKKSEEFNKKPENQKIN